MMLNPYFWFYLITAIASWSVYLLYLAITYTISITDHQASRSFPRERAGETMTIYFPKIDATLVGWGFDISMTGVGIKVNLPFIVHENELAEVSVKGLTRSQHRIDCVIRRVIKDGEEVILGAEFIVDNSNFFKIVSFVYGQGSKMVTALALKNLGRIISYLFFIGDVSDERKAHAHTTPKSAK